VSNSTSKVSIIIPVFNNWALTKQCLNSLVKSFEAPDNSKLSPIMDAEIIVVDNASYDETAGEIENWQKETNKKIIYLRQSQNLGFAKACNAGASAATSNYFVFLNNDTYVFKGAMESLLQTAKTSDSVGIVGSRLIYPNYTIQHAGMALDKDYNWHHVFRTFPAEHPAVLIKRSFQAVTGACLFIKKHIFVSVGGFDEGYLNSHEDVDLCFKVRKRNYEVVYDPNSVLIHFERMSQGRLGTDNVARERFLTLWKSNAKLDLEQMQSDFANSQAYRLKSIVDQKMQKSNPYDTVPPHEWPTHPECVEFRVNQFEINQLQQCQNHLDLLATKEELLNTQHLVNSLKRQIDLVKQSKTYRLGDGIKKLMFFQRK
jgi:GT2 family glycosyltransferase